MEKIIKQKVDLIAECIFEKIKNQGNESYGLYSGEFGILLFLFYYSKYTKSRKYKSLTYEYAEKLLNGFLNSVSLHTFCNGLSGILYLLEFLRENDFIDMDVSNAWSLLNNNLINSMKHDIQREYYDFMHGALGVGLYFLKKGTNPQCIQELLDFLYQTAEKDSYNQTCKWRSMIQMTQNANDSSPVYNLSLSHGMSSIIIFLSRVIKSGKKNEMIPEMLSGAVNYVLSQQKEFTQFGSYFPNYIPINASESVSKSRLAWCYGDLGIGMALWQAGKVIDNSVWKAKGLEVLLWSTQRRKQEDGFIRDAGICHGAAGLAMIFHRMYLETKLNEFKDATDFWMRQILNLSRFADGLAGYKTLLIDEWKCDYSLLTGISGIGLVLLSLLSGNKQTWDEMLLCHNHFTFHFL